MKVVYQLIALIFAIGLILGPKSLMQVSAWGIMLVDYSEDSTFSNAIQDTFSGKRPCNMCLSLAESPPKDFSLNLSQNPVLDTLKTFLSEDPLGLRVPLAIITKLRFILTFQIPEGVLLIETPPPKFI
ncbi:MAG: hypothetical protein AAF212_10450 [Verrucomicrobiota bacterium]